MTLIAVMPIFMPVQIIIPVHAVTQLSSNASRAAFARQKICWYLIPQFLFGSILGITVFGLVFFQLPGQWIPFCIGTYILLTLWSRPFDAMIRRYESFFSAGFFQSGLGMLVGATGPLTTVILSKKLKDKDQVIATGALFMLISHLLKILLFGIGGFVYAEHWRLMLFMAVGAIIGSWLGTKMRRFVKSELYFKGVKLLLTVLAIKMLASTIY